jgi:hypothetical protein
MKLEQTESMSFEDLYDSRDQGTSAVNSEMMSPSISRHSGYKIYSYPSVGQYALLSTTQYKMPPRAPLPRSLHLPSHTTASAKPTWKAPKPHLANLHHDVPPPFQQLFQPPQTPQLPPRRQPIYNPGGFGLGGSFKNDKGKQKAVEDVEAKEGDAEACYVVCHPFH